MKTRIIDSRGFRIREGGPGQLGQDRSPQRGEGGMVTVLFIGLLAIMMILVAAESRSLYLLHHNVRLLEQQQIKRLNSEATNAVSTVTQP
jgi:hypothetical protein